MNLPNLEETIVAVSTGWSPAMLGIVRASCPEAISFGSRLLTSEAVAQEVRSFSTHREVRIAIDGLPSIPATFLISRAPHSYTGQDLIEIHTSGSLPVLRALCASLIRLGARRALPGEFTARAYIAGKMKSHEIAGVLGRISARTEADARVAARLGAGDAHTTLNRLREQLLEALARLEAGIDFADEDDIRFITAPELRAILDGVLSELATFEAANRTGRQALPHVALVGLPNAGKSTLFNALLGQERAIVSPIVGTTRDVLSAELESQGVRFVLQDCAGLGESADDLELAAHHASEATADRADLVLWIHDRSVPWQAIESVACDRFSVSRRILIWTKADLQSTVNEDSHPRFAEELTVVATNPEDVANVRHVAARTIRSLAGADDRGPVARPEIVHAMQRATKLLQTDDCNALQPELVALELRTALAAFEETGMESLPEVVLGRIFSQFCIGK